ncbi:MAG: hypothetical protein JEZ09_18085 [Salinivirgaceae bacterium]|nr:hypothetical protein [Salinivirgaceae bacterium]
MNDNQNQLDSRYLILGSDPSGKISYNREKALAKIMDKSDRIKPKGFWATLGWRDDKDGEKAFNYQIVNSKTGNSDFEKRDVTTTSIVNELQSFNTQIKDVKNDVLERYINFNESNFDLNWHDYKNYDEIPELRLDLFLQPDQGAMVYYYHQKKDNLGKLNDSEVYEQFIQPQPTKNHDTNRDRLTYFFKALPPFEYELNSEGNIDWSTEKNLASFIVKIVTFKRNEGKPAELLEEFFSPENFKTLVKTKGGSITYTLFGKKKNGLLIYDNQVESSTVHTSKKDSYTMAGAFFKVSKKYAIDRSKKTLLLIHGTFSNTYNTFEGLVKLNGDSSELKDFLRNNKYEQLIAFDHPTISADVFQNINDFKALIGDEIFEQSVSLLAASRGCILAQAMGADKTLPFTIDKALLFSPANGVGYFDVGEKLATGLGILKKITGSTPGKYIFALLQFSAKFFLDQPGSQQMTFKSESLNKVIHLKPVVANSQYTAIINDWEKKLVKKGVKRVWMQTLDFTIKFMLGLKHDFVVGTKGQRNLPKAFEIDTKPMASTHCKYFDQNQLRYRKGGVVNLSNFMRRYL